MDEKNPEKAKESGRSQVLIITVVIATLLAVYFVPDLGKNTSQPASVSKSQPNNSPEVVVQPVVEPVPEPAAPQDITSIEIIRSTEETQPSLLPSNSASESNNAIENTPAVTTAVVKQPPGKQARELIARVRNYGDIDLDSLYSEAQRHQQQGAIEDAYLLYFFTAREGHIPSALTLGKQSDPATFDASNSVFNNSDLGQAFKWFNKAAANGSDEAIASVERLRSQLEHNAAAGDPQAQRLVLQWQQ